MPLSDIKIRNLKSREKPYKVSDFEGLFILVKVSGAKSWRFKYRVDGKERLLVIGDYPAVSLANARIARDAAKYQLANDIDPNEAKQEDKRTDLKPRGKPLNASAKRSSPSNPKKENRRQRCQKPNITSNWQTLISVTNQSRKLPRQ